MTLKAGNAVLGQAIALAEARWGERLAAAYAIGSLAHGGFSPHVSDVDLALLLSAPADDRDEQRVESLKGVVGSSGLPLADRLSVFWGWVDAEDAFLGGGRLPPVDLLDLKRHGVLEHGRDLRASLPTPSHRDLVVSSAKFALRRLDNEEGARYMADARSLAATDLKQLTKFVLYPVRLLFTARTGHVGMNIEAVRQFPASAPRSATELANKALEWRVRPPDLADDEVVQAVARGLKPLYRMFTEDYSRRLRELGEDELAQAYRAWSRRIAELA